MIGLGVGIDYSLFIVTRFRQLLHEGLEPRELSPRDGMTAVELPLERLVEGLARLAERAGFASASLITAVDHHPKSPRFRLVHQLWSVDHADRVRIETWLDDKEPVAPTVTHIWPGSAYMERECFDMFGIRFEGHAGLKRILMPEEYDHFPLRKEFPHQGIEPDRLYRAWERERREQFFERLAEESR